MRCAQHIPGRLRRCDWADVGMPARFAFIFFPSFFGGAAFLGLISHPASMSPCRPPRISLSPCRTSSLVILCDTPTNHFRRSFARHPFFLGVLLLVVAQINNATGCLVDLHETFHVMLGPDVAAALSARACSRQPSFLSRGVRVPWAPAACS